MATSKKEIKFDGDGHRSTEIHTDNAISVKRKRQKNSENHSRYALPKLFGKNGHVSGENHIGVADLAVKERQVHSETQRDNALLKTGATNGQGHTEIPTGHAVSLPTDSAMPDHNAFENQSHNIRLAESIKKLVGVYRVRKVWVRSMNRLGNTGRAICRSHIGRLNTELEIDKVKAEGMKLWSAITSNGKKIHELLTDDLMFACEPYLQAIETFAKPRKALEKQLEKMAEELPGADYIKNTKGLGFLGYAQIIAECHGTNYQGFFDFPNVSKVHKRMELSVGADGKRERKQAGVDNGYSGERRSILWAIGESIIKTGGFYAGVYRKYKEQEIAKALLREDNNKPIVIHLRAKRRMEKAILRDLWAVWHGRPLGDMNIRESVHVLTEIQMDFEQFQPYLPEDVETFI